MSDVIDHVGIRASDMSASRRMYEAALAELGFSVVGEGDFEGDAYVLFGRGQTDDFSLHTVGREPGRDRVTTGAHVAFTAPSAEYSGHYFAAFVVDPDGNNVAPVRCIALLAALRLKAPCASMHSSSSRGGDMHIDKDLVAASATPLVLAILAERESYGYAILKRVRALSGGELEWTDGMLYPLLHRLRRLGYVTTEWRTPPEGRRRKYYAITDEGRAALADQQQQWVTVTRALKDVWPGSAGVLTALGEA